MNIRDLLRWFLEQIYNYNLFIPDEDEYDDDDDEPKDLATAVRHQIYATRLYIPLLIVTLYILFFIAFVDPQTRTVTISDISPTRFNQLRLEHDTTLSCPCSTITVPHHNFVSNTISFHPVCSSVFTSKQWIEALYLPYASTFLVMDFRTTASSQFELLATLCTLSQDTVSQALVNFDNSQFVTIQLLSEDEVQSQINESVELTKASTLFQVTSSVSFLQITTRSNFLISALNTNVMIQIFTSTSQFQSLSVDSTSYLNKNLSTSDALYSALCYLKSSTTPAGFYALPFYESANNHQFWPDNPPHFEPTASAMVDGFFGGCTPLDALLVSTLDCLYNVTCLGLFADYFPGLNQTNLNWTHGLSPTNRKNDLLKNNMDNLFIEEWSANVNYSKYFAECAPTNCTYSEMVPTNFSYTITLLLSLFGGLTIILRLIAASLVNVSLKFKSRLIHAKFDTVYLVTCIQKLSRWVKQLNMFKSANNRLTDDIKRQRITTRTYLILLAGSIIVLSVFTTLSTQADKVTVSNPSLATYKHLQKLYPSVLQCPCLNVVIPYETFISLSPTLHQVCSSDFVSESWILLLSYVDISSENKYQWRGLGTKHFRLLSTICQLANKTIDDAVRGFIMRSFITSIVLTESDFDVQRNTAFSQLIQSLITHFSLLIDMNHLFTQVDQPYTTFDNAELIFSNTTNETNNQQLLQLKFNFTGVKNVNFTSVDCICATDPHCQSSIAIYEWNESSNNDSIFYVVPGLVMGCFTIDSLLLSTLECYYLDFCLSLQYQYINNSLQSFFSNIPWFKAHSLVYNSALSRFPPNTSLSTIVKEMMVEQWNNASSFDRYYEACAPSYCIYPYTIRTISFIGMVIKLVSMIGGLTVALRFITLQLVDVVFIILRRRKRMQRQANPKLCDQLRMALRKLARFLYTTVLNLNIFSPSAFGSDIDRKRVRRLCQLATRLYIGLLIIGFVILAIYTIIQPQTLRKSFINPSLNIYNRLLLDHNDALQCRCSSISSTYDQFIKIETVFHQICSSPFVSDQWRTNVTAGLAPDLSIYADRDYRRFISAHLQFLSGLCHLSIQSMNDAVVQFLSSSFVAAQLIPPSTFYAQIESLIEQSRSNAPTTFARLLFLLRATNHGNAIISAYATNFEYIFPWYNLSSSPAISQAVIYDDGCSCASNASCTTQAGFIETNSYQLLPIKGLKMGCTPSESFLASTLECFYDSTCINLLQEKINNINRSNVRDIPLLFLTNISRFSMSTTVIDLVQDLFIENWTTTINYSAYFDQCSSTLCSYTYTQQVNPLYTVTVFLGLYGGLTLILQWICPNIVYLVDKINKYRKKRRSIVEPMHTINVTTVEMVNTTLDTIHVRDITVGSKSVSTASTPPTSLFLTLMRYLVFGIILLILLAAAIIITSVYLNRQISNQVTLANDSNFYTSSEITGTIALTTTVSTSTAPTCQLTFQPIVSYDTGFNSQPMSSVVGDFNGDGLLDLAVANYGASNIGVLLGKNNGTFGAQTTYSTGNGSFPNAVVTDDFNSDSQLDLAVAILGIGNVGVLLGKGNGTFEAQMTLSIDPMNIPKSIVADDFNSDGEKDLVVANELSCNVGVLLGNGDGTFGEETTFFPGTIGYPNTVVAGDFNNDGQLDLAVSNGLFDNVNVLLNNGNGVFGTSMTFTTGTYSDPCSVAVGDFNNDGRLDLAVVSSGQNNVGIMLGNDITVFEAQMTFSTGVYSRPNSIVVDDFNHDGRLDLAVSNGYTHNIVIFLGIGNGTFLAQTAFSTGALSTPSSIASADFNNDGKLDLVITDNTLNNVGILLNTCDCCIP